MHQTFASTGPCCGRQEDWQSELARTRLPPRSVAFRIGYLTSGLYAGTTGWALMEAIGYKWDIIAGVLHRLKWHREPVPESELARSVFCILRVSSSMYMAPKCNGLTC
jgi:hypothetical protein